MPKQSMYLLGLSGGKFRYLSQYGQFTGAVEEITKRKHPPRGAQNSIPAEVVKFDSEHNEAPFRRGLDGGVIADEEGFPEVEQY